MPVRKFRWSKDYESAEEELIHLLDRKSIHATRIHVEPHEKISIPITHSIHIWCAEGSFTLNINTVHFSMQPGDALDIPDRVDVSGQSGMTGCAFYISEQ
jgi:hypothetical protein